MTILVILSSNHEHGISFYVFVLTRFDGVLWLEYKRLSFSSLNLLLGISVFLMVVSGTTMLISLPYDGCLCKEMPRIFVY